MSNEDKPTQPDDEKIGDAREVLTAGCCLVCVCVCACPASLWGTPLASLPVCQLATILNISSLIAQKIRANSDSTWHRLTLRWHRNASCAPALPSPHHHPPPPVLYPPCPAPSFLPMLCQPPLTGAVPSVTAECPLLVEAVQSIQSSVWFGNAFCHPSYVIPTMI